MRLIIYFLFLLLLGTVIGNDWLVQQIENRAKFFDRGDNEYNGRFYVHKPLGYIKITNEWDHITPRLERPLVPRFEYV